jgi:hypothetical protein
MDLLKQISDEQAEDWDDGKIDNETMVMILQNKVYELVDKINELTIKQEDWGKQCNKDFYRINKLEKKNDK